MFEFITRPLRFVKIFLSDDNLNELRDVILNETSEKREPMDLGLAYIVNSTEDVEAVSLSRDKPAPLIKGYDFLTGKTLFTASPEEHDEYLKAFPLERVGQMEWISTQKDAVCTEVESFVRAWLQNPANGSGGRVDFARLAFDTTFAVLSRTFLGVDHDAAQQKDFEHMAIYLNRYLLYQVPPMAPSYFSAKKRWFARVHDIVTARQAEHREKGDAFDRGDLLSTLLKQGVEIDDLTERSLSQAYWAGEFTISAVTLGAVFHIAKDPAVRDYLLSDVDGHGLAVAKEALRMYPGAPIYDRGVHKDRPIELPSGKTLTKGARPFVCPHIIGTDPVYWPEPTKFDPKRFEGHTGYHDKAFVPFGYPPELGGRACNGRYYGLAVLPWIIGTLFEKFDIEMHAEKVQMIEYAACAYSSIPMPATVTPKAAAAEQPAAAE